MSKSGGRPLRISGSGREVLKDIREWSGGPTGYPEVVGMPSRISRSGRDTLPNVPEWWEALLDVRQLSGGPRMSGNGQETLLDVREPLPDVR